MSYTKHLNGWLVVIKAINRINGMILPSRSEGHVNYIFIRKNKIKQMKTLEIDQDNS